MVILVALVILWTPFLTAKMLLARRANAAGTPRPQSSRTQPPSGLASEPCHYDRSLWTALDDRQLTRLLADSAPRSSTE
jgi:hypothetical protein